ncbi:MAG TPA: tyrosine-type recombinase/integrase [Candidatus Binataceae bacterium]|nr:tyrosine-type recombinase/integrase [Candidatus Binataceae bacterium]
MAQIKKRHAANCPGADCRCPYRLDYRPTGLAGPRKRIEFKTKKLAEQYLAHTKVKAVAGEYLDPVKIPIFGALASQWLIDRAGRHPATLAGWQVHLRHLAPLNDLRLDQVTVPRIEQLRDELREKLGTRTVNAILTTLRSVFKLAIRRKYVTQNTAAQAEPSREDTVELMGTEEDSRSDGLRAIRPDEAFSAPEISRLIEHADDGLFRALFATVAATGLRPEEAYALRWSDVELDNARLFVRRSLSWARGAAETGRVRPKFYAPKTRAGVRTLPMPPALVGILRVWKLRCPKGAFDLVFCRADGQPLHRSNVLRQGMYPALRRAGLRGGNLKTLRHSFASGMIAAGAPITEVQGLMGHSNPAVTLKVYSHWLKDSSSGAIIRFAGAFLPGAENCGQNVGTETIVALRPKTARSSKHLI